MTNEKMTVLPDGMIPQFDYSGLSEQTVADLHLAEDEYRRGKKLAERGLVHMGDAIAIAHDTLCGVVALCDNSKHGNRGDDTFRAWCLSIGITKDAAYRLLQVSALMDGSNPRQREILESLPPTLLYAIAKPSAPPELVEQAKNGGITTNKQYQELLAQLKAKDDELAAEKNRADAAETRLKNSCIAEQNAREAMQAAENARDAALADVNGLNEQNRQLRAENADLKKNQPITAVIDEEEVERRAAEKAWGMAAARNSELQADKEELQQKNADLEQELAEVRATRSLDPVEDKEIADSCCISIESTWAMAESAFERLIGSGESLNNSAHTLIRICDQIHANLVDKIIRNDKETLYE